MVAKGIQVSVTQVAAGTVIGASIEAVLPPRIEGASVTTQVFEALVQVGMNGAALSLFAGLIRGEGNDPTFGIPFQSALYSSQPELQKRIALLAGLVKVRVARVSRQMAARVAAL